MVVLALAAVTGSTACKAHAPSAPTVNAVGVRRDVGTVSRIYMAYDEALPSRVAWYLCKGEAASVDTIIESFPDARGAHATEAARVLRSRKDLPGAIRAESGSDSAGSPSALVAAARIRETIYLDERLTAAEFSDPVVGKGCHEIVSDRAGANPNATILNSEDLAQPLYAALSLCMGLTKETLLMAGMLLSGNKPKVRNLLGFGMERTASAEVGASLASLLGADVTCGSGTGEVFKRLAETHDAKNIPSKMFLNHTDRVLKTAAALFTLGREGGARREINARLRGLPAVLQARISEDDAQFQKNISEEKNSEAAAIFMPYVVVTWNLLESRDTMAPRAAGAPVALTQDAMAYLSAFAQRVGTQVNAAAVETVGRVP